MKKIFENFYLFSKLGLSLILLICLIGVLYVFFINYQKERSNSKSNLLIEHNLKSNIEKNSDLIEKVSNEIKLNKKTLDSIKNDIKSISNQNETLDISNLNDSILLLNQNFKLLSEEIENLKQVRLNSQPIQNKDQSYIIENNKQDVIELILYKYENNMRFDQDLAYLKKLIGENNIPNFEKITILSTKTFKGHEYLLTIFNDEVNNYLRNKINKNSNSFLSKIILPYLEISPTSENTVNSDLIINIKKIKLDIEKRNMENALKNLKTINEYQINFDLSFKEISKYINFKRELLSLK